MCSFESAIVEISGICNAKCKWCVTGRDNRYGKFTNKTFMSYEKFIQIYNHLMQLDLINKKADMMLYSWGEPFLNPEAFKIFEFLSNIKQMFSLSTNGSVYKKANTRDTYKYMSSITFSLPGFSQESYNKMHGFEFRVIQQNIIKLLDDMRENGFTGNALIVFHVYKFNQHEIIAAKQFADILHAQFIPYYAYFNGLSLVQKFVNRTFSADEWKEVQDELCLHYLERRYGETSADFKCPLRKILTIDEMGNLVLCCAADCRIEGYVLGEILSFGKEKIIEELDKAMSENISCMECHSKKIDAWLTKYQKWEGQLSE